MLPTPSFQSSTTPRFQWALSPLFIKPQQPSKVILKIPLPSDHCLPGIWFIWLATSINLCIQYRSSIILTSKEMQEETCLKLSCLMVQLKTSILFGTQELFAYKMTHTDSSDQWICKTRRNLNIWLFRWSICMVMMLKTLLKL